MNAELLLVIYIFFIICYLILLNKDPDAFPLIFVRSRMNSNSQAAVRHRCTIVDSVSGYQEQKIRAVHYAEISSLVRCM